MSERTKNSWNKGKTGPGSRSSSGLSRDSPEERPRYLIRQMKDLREPMHILMDCCPSFFTVPVFRSRMRPEERRTQAPDAAAAGAVAAARAPGNGGDEQDKRRQWYL